MTLVNEWKKNISILLKFKLCMVRFRLICFVVLAVMVLKHRSGSQGEHGEGCGEGSLGVSEVVDEDLGMCDDSKYLCSE